MNAPDSKYEKKCKLKKGDEVIVISGRAKGSTGKINRVELKHDRVYIEGVNIYKRHVKPDMKHPDGGIQDKVMPLHICKVALVDPKTKKPTRVGYKVEGTQKVRIAKKSGSTLA
jgi:large subunit ribosomal protein L24